MASIKAEEARKYLVQRVADELEDILTGQIELAKGIYQKVEEGVSSTRVYQKLPDFSVAEYLLNQLVGRPKEVTEMKLETVHEIDPKRKANISRTLGIKG